jgi:hypothetical protein
MKRIVLIAVAIAVLTATGLLVFAPDASAVPTYSRRYGVECSGCHTMWGALNGAGVTFRLSGYRAMNGKDLEPVSKDIEISPGVVIPSTFPFSIITGVGYDYRTQTNDSSAGVRSVQRGSSIDLEDASLFLTGPIGPHLSAFMEFPMFETKEGEFLPVGRADADAMGPLQFQTEKPTFEVAKFWWNNLVGSDDNVNLLMGITHLPLGYASGKVRLSVNQYPIYERRALDLLEGSRRVDDHISEDNGLFRLSEPQGIFEVNGMIIPGASIADVGKKETFWFEYHAGITNGSQDKADNNTAKDLYGRFVMRWYRQSLGFFVLHSPDQYSDNIGKEGSSVSASLDPAFMQAYPAAVGHFKNRASRNGIDTTLSLAAIGVPVWLENQYMMNKESDPTGYGTEFKWKGGFHQLNWQISKKAITYARYDWIKGDSFDDTVVGGSTMSKPKETDVVAGVQYLVSQDVKLIAEYRHDKFEDTATTPNASIVSNGYTVRAMFGF